MEKISQEIYEYYEEINPGIRRYIPQNRTVLDVGGGFGALGEEFEKKGNKVCNIDSSEYAIRESQKRISESYIADIANPDKLPPEIKGRKFDVIVFADILEHVYDPYSTLRLFSQFLKEDGKVFISVPNIATWTTRIKILFGNFNYKDTGTLDRTHIRFFTKKSIKRLVTAADYKIEKFDITPNFAKPFVPFLKKFIKKKENFHDPKAIINSKYYQNYLKYIYPLERIVAKIWSPLFAFQFILILKKKSDDIICGYCSSNSRRK
jgi:2-polyprenyl-3-methyl-5-hydroxy-6-metoxy-1,4-benzoquinol methylase